MEEIKEKKFIIEAKGEVPFAQRTGDGYELFNNERTMKFCARRQQIRNNETGEQKSCFAVFCFVKEDDGWIQGDNYHQTETITSFVKDLNISLVRKPVIFIFKDAGAVPWFKTEEGSLSP